MPSAKESSQNETSSEEAGKNPEPVKNHERSSSFDDFVDNLQSDIENEEEDVFSRQVIAEFRNPFRAGRMTDPDGFAVIDGWCGDSMEIYLRIRREDGEERTKDVISDTRFMTDGCGASIASGSMVTRKACGMRVGDAMRISREDVLDWLEGLPKENIHCAALAAATLKKALRNVLDRC